ncbi:MAG: hypothetical protein KDK70_22440 [Myxococcales bacterium]|nr:hypothetical protein [Myxococcales bacterium]
MADAPARRRRSRWLAASVALLCAAGCKPVRHCDEGLLRERLEQLETRTTSNAEVRSLVAPTADALYTGCEGVPDWIREEIADTFSNDQLLVQGASDAAREASCGGPAAAGDYERCDLSRYLALTSAQYDALGHRPSPDFWAAAWGFEEFGVPRPLLRRYFRLLVLALDARRSTPDTVTAHPEAVVLDDTIELPLADGRLTREDAKQVRARFDRMEWESTRSLSLSLAAGTRPANLAWLAQAHDGRSMTTSLVSIQRAPDGLPVRAEVELYFSRSQSPTRCLQWDPQLDAETMMLALARTYAETHERGCLALAD